MNRDKIFDRLKSIYEDFFAPYRDEVYVLPPFALENRIETYQGDSLDQIEILMLVEDEFGIEISDGDAEKLLTVEDYLNYLTPILAHKEL